MKHATTFSGGIAILGLFLASCEQVVPFPDVGAKEQLCLRGVIGDNNSGIIIQKLYPITWQTPHMDKTGFKSDLEMEVNGEKVAVQSSNDDTYSHFSTERAFKDGDFVSIKASSEGVPEVSATVTVPKTPEIENYSFSDVGESGFLTCYLSMVKPSEVSECGYTFSSEVEYNVSVYKNDVYAYSSTEYHEIGMKSDVINSDLSYRLLNIYTFVKNAPEKITASTLISLSGGYSNQVDGVVIRNEYTAKRIRFHIMCLSPELLICARYSAHSGDTSLDSDIAFSTPIEYTNITGGKGYLGAVAKTSSEWIEL